MLRFLALIGIAVLLAAAAPIPVQKPLQQSPANPATEHAQEADASQRGTEAAPLAVKLMNTGESDSVAAQNQQREDDKTAFERHVANETIILTWGLVLVGLIQAVAIAYTALVTNKAANAAKRSADAAILQLRAFVGVTTVSLENVGTGLVPHAVVTLKNTGMSPAYNLSQMGVMGVDYFPVPQEPPGLGATFQESQPIGPGTEIHFRVDFPKALQAHHIAAFQNNTMAIYIFGTISYADAFGEKHSYELALFSNAAGGINEGSMAAFPRNTGLT